MSRAWWVCLVLVTSCARTWPKPQKGTEWHAAFRACRGGDQRACYWRANSVRSSDFDEAIKLYRASCDAGLGESCNELGFFAKDGRGLPKSGADAMKYWDRACTAGSRDGCDSLGTGWRDGVGGEVNHPRAVVAYEAACKLLDPAGCTNLGRALMKGEGVEKNASRAEALWRQVCANDEKIDDACRFLGDALVRGEGVTRDLEGGLAMLRRACRLGEAEDCRVAGVAMREFGDSLEGLRHLRTSCTWGSPRGCFELSEVLARGGTGVDDPEEADDARAWACRDGHAAACETTDAGVTSP